MNRVYNFAPGPSMLAAEVLEKVQKDLLFYGSTGMSVMEMSHRSKGYDKIFQDTKAKLRKGSVHTWPISEWTDDPFFETKQVIFIER